MPNGKLDREALPPLDGVRPAMDAPIAEPRTPVENALAQIWSELLGVSRIGVHDNFFDLGGHSLLAGKIISRVIRTFKVEITFREFFELPTVAHMAKIIGLNATNLGDEQLIGILNELDLLSDEKAQELLEKNKK
jgi:acyl carrier protein